jgi:signal transduction histidine kinase
MTVTLADLRRIDLFDDLDDEALADWVPVCEEHTTEADTMLADMGQPPPGVLLLFDGCVRTYLVDGERLEPTQRHQSPTWMGAIPAFTGAPMPVRMLAETPLRFALIPSETFLNLAFAHPAVHRRVMRQFRPVMTRMQSIEQNRERLAALGTMAAGLAHELNNPASAAQRAAADLADAVDVVGAALGHFVDSGVEREDAARILELQREALKRAASRTALDTLDAADAEDAVIDLLEDHGVSEPWRIAEPLSAAGVDGPWLDELAAAAGPRATDAALRFIAATLAASNLSTELKESTRRMSALVSAVKTYAYMDRGERVEVDIHEGIETTLTVLGHKLKHTSIGIAREYDRSLPKLTVRGSELNQVWTNLLDNAIDALGGSGTITVRTLRDGPCVAVEVSDDGPGIPPENADRVFEDFFTTKEVGQGTGLGLATARRIVVDRHDGALTVESEPGRTTFRVRIPVREGAVADGQ